MRNNNKGFTLIELLVVIAIIGLLSTLAVIALNSARQKSRDSKRVADVKQIQTALELYFADENGYPTATAQTLGDGSYSALCNAGFAASCSGTTYMGLIPEAPIPVDGSCTAGNNPYVYTSANGTTYSISFCTGAGVGDLPAGAHTASPDGLQ
jgi:general secretion pathway protein G